MNEPLHICLVMQGGHGWVGGSEYIKNIILALRTLPKATQDYVPGLLNFAGAA